MIGNFKSPPYRSEAWLACVRLIGHCVRCGAVCQPQACHRDQGKGLSQKTDDCFTWAGCEPCHVAVGTSGKYPRDERREIDIEMFGRTVREMAKQGLLKPDQKAKNRNIF